MMQNTQYRYQPYVCCPKYVWATQVHTPQPETPAPNPPEPETLFAAAAEPQAPAAEFAEEAAEPDAVSAQESAAQN